MSTRFKVDLRGIIDLAANHMYSSPDVFVREVIQNAVDAITARRQIDPGHTGGVRLELTTGENQRGSICISDDGVGLTVPEVHEFLSTVGGSSKREDAEATAERAEQSGFLGRFGIGLLSCFMVSDEIVVVTRSARTPDAPAVEWRGKVDGSYAVRELAGRELRPGTSVFLTAKEGVEEYFELERLTELAQMYAEMLPVPIVVASGTVEKRINREQPPWAIDPADDAALSETCEHSLGFRPLDAFRIATSTGGVEGYVFIRPDRSHSWGGMHRLYANGMYVGGQLAGLVPQWATFVGCVLNARGLKLTASRESLHCDSVVEACGEEIAAAIRSRLGYLLRHDPVRFEVVMGVHDTEIRGLAIKDRAFFEIIIDLLEFDTTLGRIRFGEFRREHERLLLARTSEQYRRLATVAAAAGLRVFNGGYTYHEELLTRAVERYPELEIRSFDTTDQVEEWEAPENSAEYERLTAAAQGVLASRDAELVVKAFDPPEVPAFFALGLDAEAHRQLDRTKSIASGLWNEILDAMAPRPEQLSKTCLCLNSRNPLVRRIASAPDAALQRMAVEVLFVQALMSGQHPLLKRDLEMLNKGLEGLLARSMGGGV